MLHVSVCVRVRAFAPIAKFTQRQVTMTTGFSVPEMEGGHGRGGRGGWERDFVFHCKASERVWNRIMTALHWVFIKAIQSLVFWCSGIFGGAQSRHRGSCHLNHSVVEFSLRPASARWFLHSNELKRK